ncbi:MAG: arylamine N-acetyltransferase family protein [Blastocatellia bacterium]
MEGRKEMNVDAYLARIGLDASALEIDVESLKLLQRSHLLTVPFENLDIHWKRPITIDTEKFYDKIVGEGRGGFCYELNGLFNELLRSRGFNTRIISARVFNGIDHGPEYDHAAIIVTIGGEKYLADVGFGDFTAEPLQFVLDEEQKDDAGNFVIRNFDGEYFEAAKRVDEAWKSQYIFKDIAHDLSEFTEMCDFQQYSPESHFTKGKVCSLMTENGRKTLTDIGFIVTANGEKVDTLVDSEDSFAEILQREFGIRTFLS